MKLFLMNIKGTLITYRRKIFKRKLSKFGDKNIWCSIKNRLHKLYLLSKAGRRLKFPVLCQDNYSVLMRSMRFVFCT